MAAYERVLRGMPLWLLREYLLELGGVALSDEVVQGEDWIVTLEQVEDFQVGSLVVGQVRLMLEAEPEVLQAFLPLLEQKLLRAGG
jgi:hypothetical protein